MTAIDNLLFSLSTTLPILLWLMAGVGLRRTGRLSDDFVSDGNRLVFTWGLPTLLFLNIAQAPLTAVWQGDLIAFAVTFTVLITLLLWWLPVNGPDVSRRSVVVQGAFRGNMGIVGLAMVVNAFGTEVLPLASLYLAIMTVLYNVASVVLLQLGRGRLSLWPLVIQIMRNPLIIGVLLGIAWSLTGWPLPRLAHSTLQGLADITLPIALLCIGATLRWRSLRGNRNLVLYSSTIKLIVQPALATLLAIGLGFSGQPLGILFLMMAAPTAAASFVMAKAMTNWGNLAAEIIVMTTLFSLVTTTLGLFVLRAVGLV